MRIKLVGTLALALAVSVVTAGITSSAFGTTVRAGNLILTLNGDALPRKLPARQFAPIKLKASGGIRTADGSQPPAQNRLFLEFDRNGKVFNNGLGSCSQRQLENRTTRQAERVCGRALVGKGTGLASVEFPDQAPFNASGPIRIFNGPGKGARKSVMVHTYVSIPAPTAIVIPGKLNTRYRGGRYGTSLDLRIPTIAGGYGSITRFTTLTGKRFRFRRKSRSYLYARCRDGRFQARGTLSFRNGDSIKGTVVRPCQKRAARRGRR